MTTPTVACVLRSGGDYTIGHVLRLYQQVRQNVRGGMHFVCLTDEWAALDNAAAAKHMDIDIRPLKHDYPGWWAKLELFRELRTAFYLDLDTTVVRDITHILNDQHTIAADTFMPLRDFGSSGHKPRMGSGLMMWHGDFRYLYWQFTVDPEYHMRVNATRTSWGDQGFIHRHLVSSAHYLQDAYPGQLQSWKYDTAREGLGDNTRIVCFHGKPRPWQLKENQLCLLRTR